MPRRPLPSGRPIPAGSEDRSDQTSESQISTANGSPSRVSGSPPANPTMTPQESSWWAMSFEELYTHAKSKNFGKAGKEGRKSGRVRIIKWLCENAGIKPYAATTIHTVTPVDVVVEPIVRETGAISHPEAILRTEDKGLQARIAEKERVYREWPAERLLALCMERSYQLLKDSKGKLPSRSIPAMANWLASWDVLKSDREKKWWLGDGIDLVNRAKAMGYQGPSRKYEVIVWLRSTPEEIEAAVERVAEPTPNKAPVAGKRKSVESEKPVSKRRAKGSRRPSAWD